MLLDVSIAPSYIKFGHNGGIQHPLLKIIKKIFFFKRYTRRDLNTKMKSTRFLEVEFLKPVVNTPPGVLLGNLIGFLGIPRKRIHIRKSGQLLLYLTVNGARSIRACPKK